MKKNTILSLFDLTGTWCEPYKQAGYNVIQIDLQLGIDIMDWDYKNEVNKGDVYGILNASPCDDFALSGARWFKDKDQDGRTEHSIKIAKKGMEIIEYYNPEFWVLENPMTRIHKVIPEIGELKYKFNPCDFAGYLPEHKQDEERYNKMTWLFGKFKEPVKKRIEPLQKESPVWTNPNGYPYGSVELKNWRSKTPKGFSQAFFNSNNNKEEL